MPTPQYSTASIHPRERVSYWVEVATKSFVRHQFKSLVGNSFSAALWSGQIADLGLGQFECDPCWIARGKNHIAGDNIDTVHIRLPLHNGSIASHSDRTSKTEPGRISLVDMRHPWEINFPDTATRQLTIVVPRKHLDARLGRDVKFWRFEFNPANPLVEMAVTLLKKLPDIAEHTNGAEQSRLSDLALDLLALCCKECSEYAINLSSARAVGLVRLKWEVEKHLVDPDLGASEIAARAGMSLRYANSLLSHEETSLGRYILARRLFRCREALEDPSQQSRTILDIAMSWGFTDQANFSRRFRAAFGMSPSDCRKAAMDAVVEPPDQKS